MSPSHRKPVVVFVHGFGSSSACWQHFRRLVEGAKGSGPDAELTSAFDFAYFDYPTKWINRNPWEEIPSLSRCAGLLDTELQSREYESRDIVLVGHSQGGLVIQKYLVMRLSAGEGETLQRIRQVILLATPSRGSNYVMGLRKAVFSLARNPQEKGLRTLEEDVHAMVSQIERQVLHANEVSESRMPIPFVAFGGVVDRIVPKASAQGPFGEYQDLPGNHFTILQPGSRQDRRYEAFKEALLDPPGHPRRFEIEQYTTDITVRPFAEGTLELKAGHPLGPGATYSGRHRTVRAKTVATLSRRVRFTRRNRRRDPFEIRYSTLSKGLLIARHSPPENLAPSHHKGEFEREGVHMRLRFKPPADPKEDCFLELDIYRGFDGDEQNAHFHLGRGRRSYRRMLYLLDLSAFDDGRHRMRESPKLYHNRREPLHGCTNICQERSDRDLVDPVRGDEWTWEWELSDIRGGTILLVWNVDEKDAAVG